MNGEGNKSVASSSTELCGALYASCATHPSGKLFSQDELLALGVIPGGDLVKLTECLNQLARNGLLKVMFLDNRTLWRIIGRDDAAKYQSLGVEEAIVYSYIESSGREGIWTRAIRDRSNIHQAVFNRCLKSLESKNLIKPIHSTKYPQRKIYILSELQPSKEITGGPFFTDGSLDEEFIRQLSLWVETYILDRSWLFNISRDLGKRYTGQNATSVSAISAEEGMGDRLVAKRSGGVAEVPPQRSKYPSVTDITNAINESGVSSILIRESEASQLLDVLCWDGRIVKVMDGNEFKCAWVNQPKMAGPVQSYLTESPCGGCPVSDQCDDTGIVNAGNCEYFTEWCGNT